MPARAAPRRWHLGVTEALGTFIHAAGLSGIALPGNHVLNHSGLPRGNLHPAGITGALGIKQRAIRGARPGEQLAASQFSVASPAHALGNQRAFVFGNRRAQLYQQVIMRIVTHGTLHTCNLAAALGACINQEHLMHRVAGQAIGGREHDTCKGRHGSPISQTVKTGTLEGGTTGAVIAVNVLLSHMPLGLCGDVVMETVQLVFNRLLLVLTAA